MSVLAQRVTTAAVLIGLVVWALFFLPHLAGLLFFAIFLLVGAWEWSGFLVRERFFIRSLYVASIASLGVIITLLFQPAGVEIYALTWFACAWWIGIAIWMLSGGSAMSLPAVAVAGVMGLLPAWCAVMQLLASEQGSWLFVWIAAIVAAADTGAFFVGRAIGRVKLAPAISPGKTREGMIGGIGFAALTGAGGAVVFGLDTGLFALGGAAIAAISVVGDLLESACKRRLGLKDSGWILPGHGGVLDRIDGLLAALPLFFLLLSVFGPVSQEFSSSR